MKALTLLKKTGIKPDKPILSITTEEAVEALLEAIKEYCPDFEIDKMTPEDLQTLLSDYGNCIVNYHPENYHQERAVLLKHFDMLKRYGLTRDDFHSLDFV